LIPDKFLWTAFLGVPKDTYASWDKVDRNKYITDEEFNDRVLAIKKIDDILEAGMSQTLLQAEGNPGRFIFYLKNAFHWADRPASDKEINISFKGFDTGKTKPIADEITED